MATTEVYSPPATRCDISAYRYTGMEIHELDGQWHHPGAGEILPVCALPLLVDAPCWVQFADRYYRLDGEGLYRFWNWGRVRYDSETDLPCTVEGQREYNSVIRYQGDLLALLSSVMHIHLHGYAHEQLPFADQLRQAKSGNLSLTCGYIAQFVCRFLDTVGVKARRVSGLRLEGQYNTYDNGHTLNEVFWPTLQRWVLVDVDLHRIFRDREDGEYLSLAEVSARIRRGQDFHLEPLTHAGLGGIDLTQGVQGEFCAPLLLEGVFYHPDLMKQWFRRTLRVPLVNTEEGAYFYCDDPDEHARVARYSPNYLPMSQDDWMKRFYAGENDDHATR